MSLFYIASPIGAALGVILGGLIAAAYSWRVACFMVGVPGIAMAILMLFVAEPRRGSLDPEQQADRPSLKIAVRELLRNRAFLLLVIAYTVQIFSYNPIEFWVPTILQRDKGMMLVQASATYGTMVFLGGLLGPLIGGFLGDALAKRRSLAYYWICSGSALACTVPLLAIATLHRGTPLFSAIFAEVFLGNISTGLVFAILVGIVIPGLRGTATAVILTVMHILGDGISQPLIGRVSAELAMGSPVTRPLEWLGTALHIPAPDHHLSLALIAITIPATLLASVLYLVAAYKGTSR
jgi:sugar phosphate permease